MKSKWLIVLGLAALLTGCAEEEVEIEYQRFSDVSYEIDGTRLVISSNLFFEEDRTTLKPEVVSVLRSVYRQVTEENFSHIKIVAHCDDGVTEVTARELTEYQAEMIAGYFWFRGINPADVEFVGAGFSHPIADMETPSGIFINQRIEIKLT